MPTQLRSWIDTAVRYLLAFILGAVLTLTLFKSNSVIQTGDTVHWYGRETEIVVPPGDNEGLEYTINAEVACTQAFDFDGAPNQQILLAMNNSDWIWIDCLQLVPTTNASNALGTPTPPKVPGFLFSKISDENRVSY